MNKILAFFVLAAVYQTSLVAGIDEMVNLMKEEMSIKAAKDKNKVETHIVKHVTDEDGTVMHFGIWPDCVIGTIVDNSEFVGYQIIMEEKEIIDSSNDYKKKKDHFINSYAWGKVLSYDNKQIIEMKK